jgi:hypothetical protein
MSSTLTGAAIVGGVCGAPIKHSMSPVMHNAWIQAAGLDAVYAPFAPNARAVRSLRRRASGWGDPWPQRHHSVQGAGPGRGRPRQRSGENGRGGEPAGVRRRWLDPRRQHRWTRPAGRLAEQAPGFDVTAAPVVILGAGGAARGAVAALLLAGAPQVRIVNRTGPRPGTGRRVRIQGRRGRRSRPARPAGRRWSGDQRHLARPGRRRRSGRGPDPDAGRRPSSWTWSTSRCAPNSCAAPRRRTPHGRWAGDAAAPGGPDLRGDLRRRAAGRCRRARPRC